MRSSLRAFWLSVQASYWFIPTVLTLFALILSFVTVQLDRTGISWWFEELGEWNPSAEGARSQLSAIANSMITVAATVFAVTIAAVSFASGNYGPRLLSNFMQDRGNQISLGVFVATFVYNLMVLRTIRGRDEVEEASSFVPHISILISIISVLIAVATLVYFLHHIPASIRIHTVLGGIGRRLLKHIEERFPHDGSPEDPKEEKRGEPVNATTPGYIEVIDFAGLDKLAEKSGVTIRLMVRAGDFANPALPVAEISGASLGKEGRQELCRCISLGNERTAEQDLEYLIDELVEIALRALSPGINDPHTAVTSIHWMGAAIGSLAARDLCLGPEQKDYDRERVQPIADDFGHYVRRSFGSARASVAASPIAAKVYLQTLGGLLSAASSPLRRAILIEQAHLLVKQAEFDLEGPALEEIKEELRQFDEEANRQG
jgi:uncharacterized membrane protein